jgi:glycine/D-amino acid oxidase-like deaminating enzyme
VLEQNRVASEASGRNAGFAIAGYAVEAEDLVAKVRLLFSLLVLALLVFCLSVFSLSGSVAGWHRISKEDVFIQC